MAEGFRRRTYLLRFDEGTGFEGLEVRMRGMSVDTMTTLASLADLKTDAPSAADLERLEPFWDAIGAGLIGWNVLDEDDQPVPATREAVRGEDLAMLFAITDAWMTAVAGVPAPLGGTSSDGQRSRLASMPMDRLSPSRAS